MMTSEHPNQSCAGLPSQRLALGGLLSSSAASRPDSGTATSALWSGTSGPVPRPLPSVTPPQWASTPGSPAAPPKLALAGPRRKARRGGQAHLVIPAAHAELAAHAVAGGAVVHTDAVLWGEHMGSRGGGGGPSDNSQSPNQSRPSSPPQLPRTWVGGLSGKRVGAGEMARAEAPGTRGQDCGAGRALPCRAGSWREWRGGATGRPEEPGTATRADRGPSPQCSWLRGRGPDPGPGPVFWKGLGRLPSLGREPRPR